MAHEMGHYLACRYYGIDCSYPFFLPSPFLFGTFGAVIKIRAPITTRRALFDIGIAGPILGFIVAVPLLAYGIAVSRVVPGAQDDSGIIFGVPPLMRFFFAMFHPGVDPYSLLLHPVARAAWFGLLATALNLLPVWQLDGGHIIYSLTPERHQRISLAVALGLVFMGVRYLVWLGVLGHRAAGVVAAISASAAIRSLAAARCFAEIAGRAGAGDVPIVLNSYADQ